MTWRGLSRGTHGIVLVPAQRLENIDVYNSQCVFIPNGMMRFVWHCVEMAKKNATEILFVDEVESDGKTQIH